MEPTRFVRLRASDKLFSGDSIAMQALDDAGLSDAFENGPVAGLTVGDYLLHSPSQFRKVTDDEAFDLNRARAAALREMDRVLAEWSPEVSEARERDDESGAWLVLLRPKRLELTDDWSIDSYRELTYEMHLRSGDVLKVTSQSELQARTWAVVKVSALPHEEREVWYTYKSVLAVPDNGPLRVSDADLSQSKALCFDTVCRFLLSGLDLSGESLPDPISAMEFIHRIHTDGVAESRARPTQAGPFRERLLSAMHPIVGSAGSLTGPQRRLIKTFVDAENYAAEYMRHLGFVDAVPTAAGSDGGIDVVSRHAVAQVKMEGVVTGRPVIQALMGVAAVEEKMAVAFSLAGYTAQALDWADRAGIACFEFAIDGSVVAANSVAEELRPPPD